MNKIKALFFDVGGTIFDWKNTAIEQIELLAESEKQDIGSLSFVNDWRAEMFKIHTQVRHHNLPWMNSDQMHLLALDKLMAKFTLLERIDHLQLVRSTWHNLKVFPGAAAAIERLRSRYTVVVLTILSLESIVNSSKRTGVQWDAILSCEFLGSYKPSLQAYIKAMKLLGVLPEEAMMVAAHEGDLSAAAQTGMGTIYVNVPETDNISNGFEEPSGCVFDYETRDFNALCATLNV